MAFNTAGVRALRIMAIPAIKVGFHFLVMPERVHNIIGVFNFSQGLAATGLLEKGVAPLTIVVDGFPGLSVDIILVVTL